jgi:hypothetical protein
MGGIAPLGVSRARLALTPSYSSFRFHCYSHPSFSVLAGGPGSLAARCASARRSNRPRNRPALAALRSLQLLRESVRHRTPSGFGSPTRRSRRDAWRGHSSDLAVLLLPLARERLHAPRPGSSIWHRRFAKWRRDACWPWSAWRGCASARTVRVEDSSEPGKCRLTTRRITGPGAPGCRLERSSCLRLRWKTHGGPVGYAWVARCWRRLMIRPITRLAARRCPWCC